MLDKMLTRSSSFGGNTNTPRPLIVGVLRLHFVCLSPPTRTGVEHHRGNYSDVEAKLRSSVKEIARFVVGR
jgi:hypothetical protein